MSRLRDDLRLAWRSLLKGRATTVLALATLALGIGVSTAVFSVLDSVLYRPVPFPNASRLVALWSYTTESQYIRGLFSSALVVEWRTQTDLFDRVEANERRSFVFADSSGAEMVAGVMVTPGLFGMLGVAPAQGRPFVEGDGRTGSDHHVIVSDRFWREQLHGDPQAVGREIQLDDGRYDVVGIMPATFRFPDQQTLLWTPFDVEQPPAWAAGVRRSFVPTARIHGDLTHAQVDERVKARGADLHRAAGGDGRWSARVMELGQVFDDGTSRGLTVLGGAVLFLLLIVCANVANLTLSRYVARSHDFAVRAALGASRADLVRGVVVEHLVLGAAAGVVGIGIARAAVAATLRVLPDAMTQASLNAIDLDGRTLAFLFVVSVAAALACGLPAALVGSRVDLAGVLASGSRTTAGSRRSRRFRAVLVVVEMGLAIVLLTGAALMTRTLLKLYGTDAGLDMRGLVTMDLAMPAPAYADAGVRDRFTADLISRLRSLPAVRAASAGSSVPPDQVMVSIGQIEFGDRPGSPTKEELVSTYGVWPGYFQAAGIRITDGRAFRDDEASGSAVVSAGFASEYFPGRSAVGMRFRIGKDVWRTIVGVAAEVRRISLDAEGNDEYEVYLPHDQVSGVLTVSRPTSTIAEYRTMIVRSDAPAAIASRLARAAHDVDPGVVVSKTTLASHVFADRIARPRVLFLMLAVFAGVGLVLAAAGLYGVLSYLVVLRRREIGVRLALGARPSDVRRLIAASGLWLAFVGTCLGLGTALLLVRAMRALLYEVDPFDPVSLAVVCGLLLATAGLACWRPARRAMRLDPVTLLRES